MEASIVYWSLSREIDTVTQVQNLDEAVYILSNATTFS